jgi:hypothetical protein
VSPKLRTLSIPQARRIALAAQGFADRPPNGRVTASHLRRVLRRVGLIQIDSVNVLVRSHYLPVFSRLGPYQRSLLDDYAYGRRQLFEYWGHEASFIPIEHYPLFRHRMKDGGPRWRLVEKMRDEPEYMQSLLEEVRQKGPLAVSDLEDPQRRPGTWWSWGLGKAALEAHFADGTVTAAERRGFIRAYDISERVIPSEILDAEPPSEDDAQRELLLLSARAHGVGTARDLADYYRLPILKSRELLKELAETGPLQEVEVAGWKDTAYLHPEAKLPRRIEARALLSPFDSLIWERDRTERLFGFRYRLEIYVPQPKRVYGYYVLPFLLGSDLVGRVDLKADRKAKRLLVRGVYCEPDHDKDRVASELAPELRSMAEWLELDDVVVERRGDLFATLGEYLS